MAERSLHGGERAEPSWWSLCASDEVEGIMTLSWLSVSDFFFFFLFFFFFFKGQFSAAAFTVCGPSDPQQGQTNIYWFGGDRLI